MLEFEQLLTLDLQQSGRIQYLTVLSRSKFVYTKLMETGVKYCFVKTGLADGYIFIPVITIVVCGSYVAHKACSSGRLAPHGGLRLVHVRTRVG